MSESEVTVRSTQIVARVGGGTQEVTILNILRAYDENGRDYAYFLTEEGRVGWCALDTMTEVVL